MFERNNPAQIVISLLLSMLILNLAAYTQIAYVFELDVRAHYFIVPNIVGIAFGLLIGKIRWLQNRLRLNEGILRLKVQEKTNQLALTNYKLKVELEHLKNAESKIGELNNLLSKSHDAIFIHHPKQGCLYLNQSARAYYQLNDIENVDIFKHIRFVNRDAVKEALKQVEKDSFWNGDLSHIGDNESIYTAECRWTKYEKEDGGNGELIMIHTDVTEQRQVQKVLMQTQRLESMGKLAAGIAHDLKNIFTPIIIGLDMLTDLGPLTPEMQKSALDNVKKAARKGSDTVIKLLEYSRGKIPNFEVSEVYPILLKTNDLFKTMISDGIDFQSAFDEGQMQINCDASQIEQALINVLMNAKEAVEEKGQISFTAESFIPTREKRPLYPGLTENCYILITIRDNGVGIPTQIQNQIFDPLFSTKKRGAGTGLGLFAVANIVKSHQGHIFVDSKIGDGTTFTLLFPTIQK
jgi:two-component system cell cycle sensor histidine kinase/response regulator CckA